MCCNQNEIVIRLLDRSNQLFTLRMINLFRIHLAQLGPIIYEEWLCKSLLYVA